jgi:hypothetical protein
MKILAWEAHVSSGEPRALFEFKHKVDEKRRSLSNLEIFILIGRNIEIFYIYRPNS